MNLQRTYIVSAIINRIQNSWLIVVLIFVPLVLGTLYGVMYDSILDVSIPILTDSGLESSGLVEVIAIDHLLSSTAKMQLSVLTGMTFFLVSGFAALFVKHRKAHMSHRLIAMGYENQHVFIGEGLSYLLASILIITGFNVLFIVINQIPMDLEPLLWVQFFSLILVQAFFATAYALLALGLFKDEKTFSYFHFLPAFIISFLGGAFFPVDQISNSGLYEWMPNYQLNQLYFNFYSLKSIESTISYLPLIIAALIFTAIGYKYFSLKESKS